MYVLSEKSQERLATVDNRLQKLIKEALKCCPLDFGIPQYGGKRTAEEQEILFARGLSKCDGFKRKSRHQSGLAVDVFAFVNGKASWDPVHLSLIAGSILTIAKQKGLNIRWGGTFGSDRWKGWDMPHFEIVGE